MSKYGNVSAVPLSLAVFLASDSYDYDDDPHTISATSLMKPLRQLILASRVKPEDHPVDLIAMTSSRMGSAIHEAFERAWVDDAKRNRAMDDLGIPKRVRDRIVVNPTATVVARDPDIIPVYLEQRAYKQVGKWRVSGKFDFVAEGRVQDVKSTSVYTFMNNTNDAKYAWQGSLYRWLNPEIITDDQMAIQFIFTDWAAMTARQDPKYPQTRVLQKIFPLHTVAETQAFVERKLAAIEQYWDADEADIPECDDEDLWRSDPVFKYYANGDTTAKRSTKNFDTELEAHTYRIEQGKGAVKAVPGQAKACKYCSGFMACTQKDRLVASGDLVL